MILTRRQKITVVILVLYWIALAFVSHIRIPELVYKAQVFDKWLHFLAYLDLIFLVWFSIRPDDKVSWKSRLVWLVLITVCVYGGIDELLQPYFGRTKDLGDFLANAAGILTGLILFTFLAFWQALLAVLAITIFGLTNLARANLSKLLPISDCLFHIIAYGGITAVLVRLMTLCLPNVTKTIRSLLALVIPVFFLLVVKGASVLLGRQFDRTDLLFAVLGIVIVAIISYLTGFICDFRRSGVKGV